jgi:peptidoglycan/LPS O-acetylase OafA/YrhL
MKSIGEVSLLPRPTTPLVYLPQLDAVRAFAVSLVLWHHWYGPPDYKIQFGAIGVWIFFVISGFLITRILLKSRAETVRGNRRALVTFYVRRVLRIFPLYYFILLVGLLTSASLRGMWPWYVGYLQNFKMMMNENDPFIFGPHLWSLAVEEQFYLVWPWLVLFTPRVLLLPIIGSGIVLAIALRMVCTHLGWTAFQVYAFTPDNLDTLGLGALLAYFVTYRPGQVVVLRRVALGAGIAILLGAGFLRSHVVDWGLMAMPTGLIAVWVIAHIANGVGGVRGLAGRAMSFGPSVYMGRISYGIYVYHYFVPDVMKPVFARLHVREQGFWFGVICFSVTIAVASLSWFLLENPINSLKNRFSISSRRLKSDGELARASH